MALCSKSGLMLTALIVFLLIGGESFCLGQDRAETPAPPTGNGPEQGTVSAGDSVAAPSGSISGTVVDQTGAVIAGAEVKLTHGSEQQSIEEDVRSNGDGQFSFSNIAAGAFRLTITSAGFQSGTSAGILHAGQMDVVPQITLAVAPNISEVEVGLSQTEVAEEEVKVEEKQRVLGVLPNFYVSYIPNAAPLDAKQKFNLAWKTVVDPFTFVFVGGAAGVEQAQNHFVGYGQGSEGYAKRYGAGYADTVSGTFIGSALLPVLLKQDPRYFYKGKGSTPSRVLYAIASSFICKGDNRRWQPNYSNVLGSIAAGGISNLYYPAQDRNGVGLTFENAGIGIVQSAVANLFQEFFIRKLTPKAGKEAPAQP
jgi:hypothetical protein